MLDLGSWYFRTWELRNNIYQMVLTISSIMTHKKMQLFESPTLSTLSSAHIALVWYFLIQYDFAPHRTHCPNQLKSTNWANFTPLALRANKHHRYRSRTGATLQPVSHPHSKKKHNNCRFMVQRKLFPTNQYSRWTNRTALQIFIPLAEHWAPRERFSNALKSVLHTVSPTRSCGSPWVKVVSRPANKRFESMAKIRVDRTDRCNNIISACPKQAQPVNEECAAVSEPATSLVNRAHCQQAGGWHRDDNVLRSVSRARSQTTNGQSSEIHPSGVYRARGESRCDGATAMVPGQS